jgi:flagellar assembly protein FliH
MAGAPPRVLKKGSIPATPGTASADALLTTARERSREILAAAEAEAERLRAGAIAEVSEARSAAAAAGFAEGRGLAAAILARAGEVREAKLAELDGAVVEVAIEIARRIVGRELATRPDAVLDVARRALRAAAGSGDIVLRVATGDLAAVREADDELRGLLERGALSLAEDPTLARGEIVVEACRGRIDARIDAQLEAFRKALRAEGG